MGLKWCANYTACPETAVHNDNLGLTLVDASQKAVFAGMGQITGIVGTPADRFVEAFTAAYSLVPRLTDRTTLALELYSAAF